MMWGGTEGLWEGEGGGEFICTNQTCLSKVKCKPALKPVFIQISRCWTVEGVRAPVILTRYFL